MPSLSSEPVPLREYLVLGVKRQPLLGRGATRCHSAPITVTGKGPLGWGLRGPGPSQAATTRLLDLTSGAWPLRVSVCSSGKWAVVAGLRNQKFCNFTMSRCTQDTILF